MPELISLSWVTAAPRDVTAGSTDRRSAFTAPDPGRTQQLCYRGNLTPDPGIGMQHLPSMHHNKYVNVMQKHAPF